jgi:YD repeat-containing protein
LYAYDVANRLIATNINGVATYYHYDGLGNLVRQMRDGVITDLVWEEGSGALLGEISGANEQLYGYGPNGLAFMQKFTGGVGQGITYPLLDAQGSVRQLVGANGQTQATFSYDDWGLLRSRTGSASGSNVSGGSTGNLSLGFGGMRQSGDGLLWAGGAFYHPQLGRYLVPTN